jgi:hypothetical protein
VELDVDDFDLKGDTLYHYTKAEAAVCWIMPHARLRLSRLGSSRDPFEYKFMFLDAVQWGSSSGLVDRSKEAELELDRVRRAEFRMVSFCRNAEAGPLEQSGIRSLGCSKSRMWAQYGQDHEGVCLAFNRERLLAAVTRSGMRGVSAKDMSYGYSDSAAARIVDVTEVEKMGVRDWCVRHVQEHVDYFFFTKDADYRDEDEFRIVTHADSEQGDVYLDIVDSLIGVVIGDRFADGLLPSLKYLSDRLGVRCRRLNRRNGNPHLDRCRPISPDLRGKWADLVIPS